MYDSDTYEHICMYVQIFNGKWMKFDHVMDKKSEYSWNSDLKKGQNH